MGYPFQQMLANHRIKSVPTTSKNPQANSIGECMHQTVGNNLRTMNAMHPPDGIDSANRLVDTALANCIFASRAAIHGSLKASPGSLIFGRDMILDIPVIANWHTIQQNRQQLIYQCLIEAKTKKG